MKAGGLGTRLSEETHLKPKPMVEIGGRPILWHIMKIYSHFGINDFAVCAGYKGYVIKEYFANYWLHSSSRHGCDAGVDLRRTARSGDRDWHRSRRVSYLKRVYAGNARVLRRCREKPFGCPITPTRRVLGINIDFRDHNRNGSPSTFQPP